MYAPTAAADSCGSPGAGQGEDQRDQSGGGDDLADEMACGDAVLGGDLEDLSVEHDVGQDCADDAAEGLSDGVGGDVAGTDTGTGAPSEQPVRCRHNRVEVRAGDRPEQQDQHGQAEHRGGGVLQELQSDVVRRELLCGNAGADDDRDEQRGAGELGEQPSGQRDGVIHELLVERRRCPSSSESCCSASATMR